MSDLINRQDAIDSIVAWTVEDRPDIEMPTDLVDRVNALLSAERKGKWLPDNNSFERMYYICSECKRVTQIPRYVGGFLYDFCPNCGADMREEKK